ncbi:MAG: hypothetical protein A3G32_02795 [Deltaproteobacteria bacterium RIFCSPLOWO2_12_FULL_40_28]|nr:MAG: hypothetical protein A3C45_00175 [Deltaproteobacteria bacterium RIFCSPHIGHO2_02_FULL_40_28]OGQ20044.1 MAG: hypothetical protein A3E27_02840 [Deltaproteobacteria bacterium RIFCSPHIGHO2_12_FULL_40_32]OGQ40611.1 MAG: hypothetical protein A3I69_10265 [Deltaproteobacteria bacterium RIFCSPLOWO2_02_FULL_40_36]OGQ54280.1 MAG: hypothetical protein A3G32_02795 [Deltaproteobacteria bacterium RIFCSPLOWO2_12_FULL_40_28]
MYINESDTFNRDKYLILKDKLDKKESFLLFGPRQTGKSTLLEQLFADSKKSKISFYCQLPSDRQILENDAEIIKRRVEALPGPKPVLVFIDEIQKVPHIMDVLQYLIDHRLIILMASGSSARKMKKISTNWLPGRVSLQHLFPLTWDEVGLTHIPQHLNRHLLYGFLPGICRLSENSQKEEKLRSYAHLYLEEEIRMEAVVRELPRFAKFLQLAALESGTSPNFSKLASQIGVTHPTVREYFQILEDTLILHRLNPMGNSRNKVLGKPKYYFFDIGVRNAAAHVGHSEGILILEHGKLFEHFIVLECLARYTGKARFFYWTDHKTEVDLVLEFAEKKVAIEIKSTNKPNAADFKGLQALGKKTRLTQKLLICRVNEPQKFDGGLAIPWYKLHYFISHTRALK